MQDKRLFSENLTALCEVFDREISNSLTKVYWETLKPYSDAQCKRAFVAAFKTCKFFPKPADLIELLDGTMEDRATEAWAKVCKAVQRIGPYESVEFDDPVIHSVIQAMGGWVQIQNCDMNEWKWRGKEFEKLYVRMSKEEDHPKALPGICENQDAATFEGPVHIGAVMEKLKLIQGGK